MVALSIGILLFLIVVVTVYLTVEWIIYSGDADDHNDPMFPER